MHNVLRIAAISLFSGFIAFVLFQGDSTATSAAFPFAQEQADSDIDLIFALNDCIQHRFEDIDKSFGFRRIVKEGETPHRFKPENATEFDVVRQLERYQVKVALYLGGRNVLGPKPNGIEGSRKPGRMINGPVLITAKDRQEAGLPKPSELWDRAQRAMISFQTSDTYDFTVDGWRFIARPVRAIESCLKCHRVDTPSTFATSGVEPKVLEAGDPLGVILYAYKH